MHQFALLFVLCVLTLGCSRADAEADARAASRQVERPVASAILQTAPLSDLGTIVDAQFRLRPDRRFLIAVGDVYALTTGKRVGPKIEFVGGVWRITAEGRDLGSLVETPTFADGLELVTELAQTLGAKDVSVADAERAARINLETPDHLGLADPLRGHGLALLAIARASHKSDTENAAQMLATSFGYGNQPAPASTDDGSIAMTPTLTLPADWPEEARKSYRETKLAAEWHQGYDQAVNFLGDRESAHEFVASLKPTSPIETQIRDWYAASVAAKFERGGDITPQQALERTPLIGGAALASLLFDYATALGAYHTGLRGAVFELFPRLDSRPDHMLPAGRLAHGVLLDPLRRDRYISAALARAPYLADFGSRAALYAQRGDAAALREIVDSADAPAEDRSVALAALGKLPGADQRDIFRRFDAILDETYEAYSTFAGYANEQRAWAEKERAARRWLTRNAETEDPIWVAFMASSLGDALEQQGRYDEAWNVVEPHVPVWSANIIARAMSLLERRDDPDAAIALGKEYIERYHGTDSRADLAEIYWRRGLHQEAAKLFAPDQQLAEGGLRRDVPRAFVTTFGEDDPIRGAAAAAALDEAGVSPWVIVDILRALREATKSAHVVAISEELLKRPSWPANSPQGAQALAQVWGAIRDSKGEAEATAWLQPRVTDSAVVQFVTIAYQNAQHDLVLAYASPQPSEMKSIEMLAFLAASMTHARVPENDPRRRALVEAVKAQGDKPKSLLPVAQYLLGMLDEDAFFLWPYMPQGRAVVAYFVGLKAASEGDYDKALPWLIVASFGEESNPPRAWAIETLRRWTAAQMTWEEIARKKIL